MPITERLLEFVARMFRNSAYQSLYQSIICTPGFELCKPEHEASIFCGEFTTSMRDLSGDPLSVQPIDSRSKSCSSAAIIADMYQV